MNQGWVYVVTGPTAYEEMGVCGIALDSVEADRMARRASEFYGVDTVPEQYTVREVPLRELLEEPIGWYEF